MHSERVDDEELERLWQLVLGRHGHRLADAERADLRQSLEGLLDAVRAVRQVPLDNSDAPLDTAVAWRARRREQP